jgi:hypothetical protein
LVLVFITKKEEKNIRKFEIVSFSTRKKVEYSPLFIRKTERKSSTTREERIETLEFINDKESKNKFIRGSPGSGKITILKKTDGGYAPNGYGGYSLDPNLEQGGLLIKTDTNGVKFTRVLNLVRSFRLQMEDIY